MPTYVTLDGSSYEIPEKFNNRELRIVNRYCMGHMNQEDAWEFEKSLGALHVAILRSKPGTPFEEIESYLDNLTPEDLSAATEAAQVGQSPPAQSSSEQNGSSSEDSGTTSDASPESETLATSGSLGWDGFQSFHSRSES